MTKKPDFLFATPDGVEIELNGARVTLRYTLGASKAIAARFDGFSEIFGRLYKFDPNAFSAVVAAGLGKSIDEVENDVFLAGHDNLLKPILEYLAWLSNGGKKPNPVEAPKADSGNV